MNAPPTRDHWQSLADGLKIRTQAFIDGKYVDAASGKAFDCISPIDGRSLGRVAECAAEDIERAVFAARRSFDSGAWSEAKPTYRKKVLLKFAQLIEQYGRRARPARIAGHGQAGHRCAQCRCVRDDPLHGVDRRGAGQGLWRSGDDGAW